MDKREYDKFVFRVKKYLTSKRLQLDPEDITHKVIEKFNCTKIPSYLDRRIVDVLRKEYGKDFQKFELYNGWQISPKTHTKINTIKEFEMKHDINMLIKILSPKEAKILRLSLQGYTDTEIGEMHKITQSRVSQIIRVIINKFQIALNIKVTNFRRSQNPRNKA